MREINKKQTVYGTFIHTQIQPTKQPIIQAHERWLVILSQCGKPSTTRATCSQHRLHPAAQWNINKYSKRQQMHINQATCYTKHACIKITMRELAPVFGPASATTDSSVLEWQYGKGTLLKTWGCCRQHRAHVLFNIRTFKLHASLALEHVCWTTFKTAPIYGPQ